MKLSVMSSIQLVAARFVVNANNIRNKGDGRSVGDLIADQVHRAGEQDEFNLHEIMGDSITTEAATVNAINYLNNFISGGNEDIFNEIFNNLVKILTDEFGVDPEDLKY
jgi:hypothetical protein